MNRSINSAFRVVFTVVFLAAPLRAADAPAPTESAPIQWQPWSDTLFQTAAQENKLVLLDLEAVWCHWCHVMDEITYADPAVREKIAKNYIAVRVDQDSRPDLSNRYEDYGWPATIVFDPKGKELAKRQGYIPPGPMADMLQAFADDPTPGPSVVAEEKIQIADKGQLDPALEQELEKRYAELYDRKQGGWGTIHKYVDVDSVELALRRSSADKNAAEMAKKTLDKNRALIDPAWGGIYQYSVGGHWTEPHYEKIMALQTDNLRAYSEAFALWKRPEDLKSALDIKKFLLSFLLSPDGAFYTSQDADLVKGEHSDKYFRLDDAARRKKGVPVVDEHIYARENGWAIEALCALYAAGGDNASLDHARAAADWVTNNRALPNGGFRHDETDKAGPYLGDSLAMARAYLALYKATADRAWLRKSEETADFIDATFKAEPAGYATAASTTAGLASAPERDENVSLARFAHLLNAYTGKAAYKDMADRAMRFVAAPQVAGRGLPGGVLLADEELSQDPTHITVIGPKGDAAAQALYATGLGAFPLDFKRIEWWDRSEDPLPNADVEYPTLDKPAAFLCANHACSLPLFTSERILARLNAPAK